MNLPSVIMKFDLPSGMHLKGIKLQVKDGKSSKVFHPHYTIAGVKDDGEKKRYHVRLTTMNVEGISIPTLPFP